ncbi:MAG: iron chelate uptake ABC transporter family permease subunit [Candidatus Coatesbacteria bacterium]|nr:iron chelate uptake ABC transporter family permease subunit [Candidatus Coatesbacteria bacterium]
MGCAESISWRGIRRRETLLLGLLGLGAVTLGLLVGPADFATPGVLILRLGRTLLGLLTGAALGAAGATLQGLTRNPLADPYLTGVSAGAGVGVALAALLGIGGLTTLGFLGRQALGFLGGIGAALLVWRLTGRRRGDSTGLIVAGVVTNAGLSGVILIILAWLPLWSQGAVLGWLMGDLASPHVDWGPLILAAGLIAACLVYLLTRSRELDALALGERRAHSLGVDIDRARGGTLLAAALATATAVTLAGIIPFVGLVAPHLVRVRLGAENRRLLPLSALAGAVLVVLADNAVRLAVCYLGLPGLPVGAALALIGGPYFFIIYRRRSVNR